MAGHGINRKLARTVAWSTSMATATYGIGAIFGNQLRQQWIIDEIQRVATAIAKDVAGLFSTTNQDNAIRAAGIPSTESMLQRRANRLFVRILTRGKSHPARELLPPSNPYGTQDELPFPLG